MKTTFFTGRSVRASATWATISALPNWRSRPPAPEAQALVQQLWREVADCLDRFGAVHFQIGRAYDYLQRLRPPPRALVQALKAQLDPRGLMNPGSLGL